MEFPTVEELSKGVAENALNEFEYRGKTLKEWINIIAEQTNPRGTYECFHCLSKSVIWDSDFDFEDFGYEGQGIVHICHCTNCGAEIEYRIPVESEDDE